MSKRVVSVRMDEELYQELKEIAEQEERSITGQLIIAVKEHVRKWKGGPAAPPLQATVEPKAESPELDDTVIELEGLLLTGQTDEAYKLVLQEWDRIEERIDRGVNRINERAMRRQVVKNLINRGVDPVLTLEVIREMAPQEDPAMKIEQEIYHRLSKKK